MNPAWIAVIGTAAGAGVTGIVGIGKAVVEALSARSQRKHDADQSKVQRDAEKAEKDAQREHERVMSLRKERAQQISYWREGLASSAARSSGLLSSMTTGHVRMPTLGAFRLRTLWAKRGFIVSARTCPPSSASRVSFGWIRY